MTDHPLVPHDIRAYMEKHQIEAGVNRALNTVLATLPQDPFSAMAVSLIDSNVVNPSLSRLRARETFLCDLAYQSMQIDVYLSYQGQERCFYSYIYTYNEAEREDFPWDNAEEKTGMREACKVINEQISPLLEGRDLLLIKKIDE